MADDEKGLERLLALMFQAHPWHGITAGEGAPDVVNAYIEIVPTDAVKYAKTRQSGVIGKTGGRSVIQCSSSGGTARATK